MPWSSNDLIRAVERQGYSKKSGRGHRGSHHVWAKPGEPGGLYNTVTIPLDAKRIPDGTIAGIARQLGIDAAALEGWRKKRKPVPKKAKPK